jgi:hypothetical protein
MSTAWSTEPSSESGVPRALVRAVVDTNVLVRGILRRREAAAVRVFDALGHDLSRSWYLRFRHELRLAQVRGELANSPWSALSDHVRALRARLRGRGGDVLREPAHPKLRYSALPAAQCSSYQDPAKGDWQLTVTSVCSHVVPGTCLNYVTQGHPTATLVNEADPSDSMVLNLDF